jgi:hypothetical protein
VTRFCSLTLFVTASLSRSRTPTTNPISRYLPSLSSLERRYKHPDRFEPPATKPQSKRRFLKPAIATPISQVLP